MSEVFNLDAIAAEADSRAFRFTYEGREWRMRHMKDFDWRLARDGIGGDLEAIDRAFREGLGPEQHAEFEKLQQSTNVATALFEAWLTHCGLSRGKSSSSAPSSASTGKPSKRASRSTTRGSGSGTSSKERSASASSSST